MLEISEGAMAGFFLTLPLHMIMVTIMALPFMLLGGAIVDFLHERSDRDRDRKVRRIPNS